MKERHPSHKGFTLAEIAIVFTIIGFIAATTIGIHKFKQNEIKKHMTFAAFQALKEFSGNNIADGNELITPGTPGTAAYDETEQKCIINNDCLNMASAYAYYDKYLFTLWNSYYYCYYSPSTSDCSSARTKASEYHENLNHFFIMGRGEGTSTDPRMIFQRTSFANNPLLITDLNCGTGPANLTLKIYGNQSKNLNINHIPLTANELNSQSFAANCFSSRGLQAAFISYVNSDGLYNYTSPFETSNENDYSDGYNYLAGRKNEIVHHDAVPATADTKTLEKALPETGAKLCEKAVDLLNIVGDSHCSDATAVNDASDFKSAIPSFKTPNSLTFYNVQANPSAGVEGDYSTQIYTIYIDIDGTERGKSKLNDDVIKFMLRRDGVVLPAADSIAANNTDYLTAAVKYENSWLGIGLPYRKAACQSGFIKGDYCLATGSYPAYGIATSCAAHFCNVYTSTPKLKFF